MILRKNPQNYKKYKFCEFFLKICVFRQILKFLKFLGYFHQIAYRDSVVAFLYCFGQCLLGIMGYFFRDWRELTFYLGLFYVPCGVLFLLPESPQYLFVKGESDKLFKVTKTMKKVNGNVETVTDEELKNRVEKAVENKLVEEKTVKTSILDLFKNGRTMSWIIIKCSILWTSGGVIHYGLSLNTGNLPGSVYRVVFLKCRF